MIQGWIRELKLEIPSAPESEIESLAACVNPDRLKNNPVRLEQTDISRIYQQLFHCIEEGDINANKELRL